MNTSQLADLQSNLLQRYLNHQPVDKQTITFLENNPWIKVASKLAPNNLVIRNWCIIDLLNGKPDHLNSIGKLFDKLSGGNDGDRVWLESYSYYKYTSEILDVYLSEFEKFTNVNYLLNLRQQINNGFAKTAYSRNGIWYPAPFGDLRDEPLSDELQKLVNLQQLETKITVANITVYKMNMYSTYYEIKGRKVGLNTHIQSKDTIASIIDGVPHGFKFYTGYPNKYSNILLELFDIVSRFF